MLVANTPGRKNARRIAALRRGPSDPAEGVTLVQRIIPEAQARAIRTKKDRSARGRLTRNGA